MMILKLGLLLSLAGGTSLAVPVRLRERSDDPNPLEAIVSSQAQVIDQLEARLAAVESRLAKQETEVGFNARFSPTSTVPVTGTQNIVFDLVDLNLGNGYDKTTGMFTAPVGGLYQFSLRISHTPPGHVHAMITKEGTQIAEVDASGNDQYPDRSSDTVAVHLKAGDRVWPKRLDGDSTLLQTAFRSSFTGVLIRADKA